MRKNKRVWKIRQKFGNRNKVEIKNRNIKHIMNNEMRRKLDCAQTA